MLVAGAGYVRSIYLELPLAAGVAHTDWASFEVLALMHMEYMHALEALIRQVQLPYTRGRCLLSEQTMPAVFILNFLELQEVRILIGTCLRYLR
jgi:hypothetical protein